MGELRRETDIVNQKSLREAEFFSNQVGVINLIKGDSPYKYAVFYRAKDLLLRFGENTDYVNYGFWSDGESTIDPSHALVRYVAGKLRLLPTDVLLNVGSGVGQPDVDIPRYLRLYQLGKLNLEGLITHRRRLDEINEAVEIVRDGQVGRCVISMG